MISGTIAEAIIRLKLIDQTGADVALKKATESTKKLDTVAKATAKSFGRLNLEMRSIAISMAGISAPLLMFVRSSIKEWANFEYEMASVKAVTQASKSEMDSLTKTVQHLGATTQFYSKEVATAAKQMGQMGLKAKEIEGLLPEVLSLAAIENIDPQRSAAVIIGAIKGIAEPLEYAGKMADLLAFAATNSASTIDDMGQALARSGAASTAAGQSFESTLSVLMTLADRNIKASKAGQAYVMILNKITKAMVDVEAGTTMQGKALAKLGFAKQESESWKVIDVLKRMRDGGLNAADAINIFGERTAKYVQTLIPAIGYTEAINKTLEENAELYAKLNQKMKDIKMDTLEGDLLELGSAFINLKTILGESVSPRFRELIDIMTNAVIKISEMMQQNPELASKLMMVATATGVLTAAIGAASIAAVAFTIAGGPILWILGGIAAAVTGAIILWNKWTEGLDSSAKSTKRISAVTEKLKGIFEGLKIVFGAVTFAIKVLFNGIREVINLLVEDIKSFFKFLDKISFGLLSKAGKYLGGAAKDVLKTFSELNKQVDWNLEMKLPSGDEAKKAQRAISDTKEEINALSETIAKNKAEIDEAAKASEELGTAMSELRDIYIKSQEGLDIIYHERYEREKQELIALYEARKTVVKEAEDEMFNFGASRAEMLFNLRSKLIDDLNKLEEKAFKKQRELEEKRLKEEEKIAKQRESATASLYDGMEEKSINWYRREITKIEKLRDSWRAANQDENDIYTRTREMMTDALNKFSAKKEDEAKGEKARAKEILETWDKIYSEMGKMTEESLAVKRKLIDAEAEEMEKILEGQADAEVAIEEWKQERLRELRIEQLEEMGKWYEGFELFFEQQRDDWGSWAEEVAETITDVFDGLQDAFSNFFESIMEGSMSFRDSLKEMWEDTKDLARSVIADIAAEFIKEQIKMLAKFVWRKGVEFLTEKTIEKSKAVTATTSNAAILAIGQATTSALVTGWMMVAAAAAAAWAAPMGGPPAAASAYAAVIAMLPGALATIAGAFEAAQIAGGVAGGAAVGSADEGTGLLGLSKDGLVYAHSGEIILNRSESENLRKSVRRGSREEVVGGGGGEGGGYGNLIVQVNNPMTRVNWDKSVRDELVPALNRYGKNNASLRMKVRKPKSRR